MNASRFSCSPRRWARLSHIVVVVFAAGCATPPPAQAPASVSGVLDLSGFSDEGAVEPLARFLLGHGYRVRVAGPLNVEVGTETMQASISPVLQPEGLDRLVVTRRFPAQPGVSSATLSAFAVELNENLNVGVFVADAGALVFQSHATFYEVISEAEIGAFLAWTGQVELALARVEGDRTLLVWTEEL